LRIAWQYSSHAGPSSGLRADTAGGSLGECVRAHHERYDQRHMFYQVAGAGFHDGSLLIGHTLFKSNPRSRRDAAGDGGN
jgi:hypothetical protein